MPRRQPRPRQEITAAPAVVEPPPPSTPAAPPVGAEPPTIAALRNVVDAIINGTSLVEHKDQIERLVYGQEERAEMIDNLLLTHDYTRLIAFLSMQNKIETELLDSARSNTLTVPERMALLRYCNEESRQLNMRVKAGSTSLKDVLGLMAKMDFATQVNEAGLRKRLASTTPQGREIVRRVAHRLAKLARPPDSQQVDDDE